jgi:ADP-dependent NAD(P)H-hydrate dehydratase / NAD(P)H-hydrate epimerase
MVKLFTVKEMQALEREADSSGLSYEKMMENAGKGLADEIQIAYSHLVKRKVIALVGSGNNGGDALVALSHLANANWETCAYIVKKRGDDDPLINTYLKNGGQVVNIGSDSKYIQLAELLKTSSVLMDGIFGTGFKLPLKEEIANLLAFVNESLEVQTERIHVVAVDCPSGVDNETGQAADDTIHAELTVTMAGIKTGLIKFPAAMFTGEIRIGSIGVIEKLKAYKNNPKFILTKDIVCNYLPERAIDAHKGTFGTALIIAGSVNYTGAALLAGLAAYRSGAGLVTLAVPAPLHESLSGHLPEATWILLPHEMGVISSDAAQVVQQNIGRASAILIGPGFGLEDATREFLTKLFMGSGSMPKGEIGFIHKEMTGAQSELLNKPIILDADGLKLMSKIKNWAKLISAPAILTPHPGEMSVLTGLPTEEIQQNRLEIAGNFANKWGHIVVLKGAFTVIASPDGQLAIVPIATPALARAGTGDVLAGLIVGLRAQGVNAFEAACAGAWIHATAGVLAAKRLGSTASVIASDVVNAVPQVMSELN